MNTLCSVLLLTLLKIVLLKGCSARKALLFPLQPINISKKEADIFSTEMAHKLHFAGWTKITEQITVNFLHCNPTNHLRKSV